MDRALTRIMEQVRLALDSSQTTPDVILSYRRQRPFAADQKGAGRSAAGYSAGRRR